MTEDNEIVRHRREKLAALRAQGNSFPNDFRRTAIAADLQARYGDVAREELASLGGRGRGRRPRDVAPRDGKSELFYAAGCLGPDSVLRAA